MTTLEAIEASLTNQAPGPNATEAIEALRAVAKALAPYLAALPPSRERSLSITHLEETVMWGVKAIVLNPSAYDPSEDDGSLPPPPDGTIEATEPEAEPVQPEPDSDPNGHLTALHEGSVPVVAGIGDEDDPMRLVPADGTVAGSFANDLAGMKPIPESDPVIALGSDGKPKLF